MIKLIDAISRGVAWLTGLVVVVMAAALVFSLLASIFFRYVVGSALSWPEEIALLLFVWIVLLTGSLGVREAFHVRLTIFISRLSTPLYWVLDRLIILGLGLFGGALAYAGHDLVQRTAEHLTPTLRLPLDYVNYSAPVCGALIVLHSLYRLLTPPKEVSLGE
jgi:TRAP-type C4-dicarboxylate transport system permease small subunit